MKKMIAIATLSVAGITKGDRYDVIERDGNFIKIVLDDGRIGFRHIGAFDIEH